ncbi:MAG: BBP7 family outer membrane beta-barrel protein [Pirellulaceae bacterium]
MDCFSRVHGWTALVVMAVFSANASTWAAETFGYVSRKPQRYETQGPSLEQEPGVNLYWHDPYLSSKESCRVWPAASNGYAPSWYGKTDMLALFREPKDDFIMTKLGPGGSNILGTRDFESEFDAGVRALLGMTCGDWYRLEVSYFGSYSWDDSAAVRNFDDNDQGGTGNLFSPFSDFGRPSGVVGLDYNNFASIRFNSRMHNGEFNVRRRVLMRPGSYEASFLVGGRYLDIEERFDYLTQSTLPTPGGTSNSLSIGTSNQLIGAQIGLLSQFLMQPRCWVDFEMKGGIFQNDADLGRAYVVVDGEGTTQATGRDSVDRTSFVGDLSLQFNYQFASCWTFYAGYNAMWVTGVALSGDNFEQDTSTLLLGPTDVDHSGQILYHGPNIGLVLAY